MAEQLPDPALLSDGELGREDTFAEQFMDWVRTELVWYAGSFTVHLLALATLLLFTLKNPGGGTANGISLEEATVEKVDADPAPLTKFEIGETPVDPSRLDTPMLTWERPAAAAAATEDYINDREKYEKQGGGRRNASQEPSLGSLGSFTSMSWGKGAKFTGPGGVGPGVGDGSYDGSGGSGHGFGYRGSGHRRASLGGNGTPASERAVGGALHWLSRHQLYDGNWSLGGYTARCTDKTCTGAGNTQADAGATAMGLLPFLAAGQTHKTPGPYRAVVRNGLLWLVRHQDRDGNLAKGCAQPMYSHGLATIALCQAYGLSGDRNLGAAAQLAVNYIIAAQNKNDFGWRYNPGDPGDTSVVGWQIMALKSAQMAGLSVGGSTFELSNKWLDLVKSGNYGEKYSYMQNTGATPAMSAVGLLCRQYLHAKRNDPMMVEGVKYLMNHMPDANIHNIYYWYYATQVLHNYTGYEWDTWNRAMRKLLISTQTTDYHSCANGSWSPDAPAKDAWGSQGGRHMVTALSALTLEIYYRYLPLYKVDAEDAAAAPDKGAQEARAAADKAK